MCCVCLSLSCSLGVHDQYDTMICPSQGNLQSKDQKSLGQKVYEFGSKLVSKIISSDSTKERKEAVEEVTRVFPGADFKAPTMPEMCRRCLGVFMRDHVELLVSGAETLLNPDNFIRDTELIYSSMQTQVLHDGAPSKRHLHVTKLWKNPGIKQVLSKPLYIVMYMVIYMCIL